MRSIRELYRVEEMARPRGDATWAVLDWAGQQTGTFTLKDLYKVYQQAGGEQGYTSFHTTIGHLTAKPWKDQEVSDKRPFSVAKQGSRGAGGTTILKWGLDRPLREPQAPEEPESEEQAALGDATDRLEASVGREALKAHIARWKGMDIHQAVADIRKHVPKRSQMDALHVASASLVSAGKANMDDVEDAENEIEYTGGGDAPETQRTNLPDAPGATSQRPATPPKADPGVQVRRKPEPEAEPDEDDPGHFGGGLTIPKQFFDDPGTERNPGREDEPSATPPPPERKKSPLSKFFKR